jgi:hypothetical protein
VSQDLTALVPGSEYTLYFDYSVPYSSAVNDGVASPCSLSVYLGGDGIADLIGFLGAAQPAWGSVRGFTFVPPCSDSTLLFGWDCSGLEDGMETDFAIDNVSLTGSSCGQSSPTTTAP